jgi:hypothetical protein
MTDSQYLKTTIYILFTKRKTGGGIRFSTAGFETPTGLPLPLFETAPAVCAALQTGKTC